MLKLSRDRKRSRFALNADFYFSSKYINDFTSWDNFTQMSAYGRTRRPGVASLVGGTCAGNPKRFFSNAESRYSYGHFLKSSTSRTRTFPKGILKYLRTATHSGGAVLPRPFLPCSLFAAPGMDRFLNLHVALKAHRHAVADVAGARPQMV